jgi:hypothetical protein
MKRFLLFVFFLTGYSPVTHAQVYNPIRVTGFNHDVVAEGDGNSSLATTTKEMDALVPSNFVLCTKQFATANAFQPPNLYGLPDSGRFSVPGRTFQMAPFDQNNVLYLMPGESETLELLQPARYTDFSLLALATEGDAQVSLRFQFSDGTTQLFNKTIEDWFNSVVPPTFSGYGRVKRIDGPINAGDYEAAQQGNPRFRNLDLVLPCEKTLVSIEITNTGPAGSQSFRAFILAVSGLERKATPSIKISTADSTACLGQPVRFTAKADSGGSAPQFAWRINGGPVAGTDSVFVSSALQDGDTVTCTLNSSAFCAVPDTAVSNKWVVKLKPLLIPEATIIRPDSACEGSEVLYEAATTNCGENPSYRWYRNGLFTSIKTNTFLLTNLSAGDSISCLIQTMETCLSTNSLSAKANPLKVLPVINLKIDTTRLKKAIQLDEAGIPLKTEPPNSIISVDGTVSNELMPASAGPGLHKIQAYIPGNSCSDTLVKEVLICDLRPTNLLIRSGQPENQIWTTERPGFICSEKTEAVIYNRWGKEVKCFENYLNDWKAEELGPGTYFYRVSYTIPGKKNSIVRTGYFSIFP